MAAVVETAFPAEEAVLGPGCAGVGLDPRGSAERHSRWQLSLVTGHVRKACLVPSATNVARTFDFAPQF